MACTLTRTILKRCETGTELDLEILRLRSRISEATYDFLTRDLLQSEVESLVA
jgi:hypothetical protein